MSEVSLFKAGDHAHQFEASLADSGNAIWLAIRGVSSGESYRLTIPQARALCDALSRKLQALAEDAELPAVREKSTPVENADEYENVPFGDADTARWQRGIFL